MENFKRIWHHLRQSPNEALGYIFCIVVLCSINQFCNFRVSNTLFYYFSSFSLVIISCYLAIHQKENHRFLYCAPFLYICWCFGEIIRGIGVIDSYWVFNQLLRGIICSLPPTIVFLFASPSLCIKPFQIVNRFIFIIGIGLFAWGLPLQAYPFLLGPFYLFYTCFIDKAPSKWSLITLVCLVIVLSQFDNRSGVIKSLFSIGVCCLFHFPVFLRNILLFLAHYFIYFIGFFFLWLGFTGRYNVFDSTYFDDKDTIVFQIVNPDDETESISRSIDTRTFIYVEAITTAFDYDCLWVGRSPAHGYISPYFTVEGPIAPGRDPSERFACEVAHINTFVWLGLVGVILMALVYIQGTSLAIWDSNNCYVKCLALLVAFQWLYGWIENMNQFHLLDLLIFAMLGICYSPGFRHMSDLEFELFFKSLFSSPKESSLFEKYRRLKTLLRVYVLSRNNSK